MKLIDYLKENINKIITIEGEINIIEKSNVLIEKLDDEILQRTITINEDSITI